MKIAEPAQLYEQRGAEAGQVISSGTWKSQKSANQSMA
jgi:hypothetical protein